jgi:hypothetical protein
MADVADNLEALRERQYAFAAHLRDPQKYPAPTDIEDRRMKIYRELFFNNVRRFLGGSFPIAQKILGEDGWSALIRDYYRDHVSHSPLFPDMPREFLNYLSDERAQNQHAENDPPFLYELAHYEWVEAGLSLAPDPEPLGAINPDGDLLEQPPVLLQPAWLLAYNYAVNEIGPDNQPDAPAAQPLHYLVMRDMSDKITFIKLNIVSARLYELLQSDNTLTGRAALEIITAELQHNDPAAVIQSGLNILEQWRTTGIIVGTAR